MKRRVHERMVIPFVLGWRLAMIALGCIGFAAAGIWMMARGMEEGVVWWSIFGCMSVVLFGGGGLFCAPAHLSRCPHY